MAKWDYYKPGVIEKELKRLAEKPFEIPKDDLRFTIGMLAAAMLVILERLGDRDGESR